MSDAAPSKVRRLEELPRDIPPPNDGWPALEARLRESGMPLDGEPRTGAQPARRWRPSVMRIVSLAAVLAAVAIGVSLDRWVLSPARPSAPLAAEASHGAEGRVPVVYMSDPRYLRERTALLRSLNARLARLPPSTRKNVLESLATIHQSMRQIQQALGREPGNALLQELLIDTYQNEMQVLSAVQQASGGGGET